MQSSQTCCEHTCDLCRDWFPFSGGNDDYAWATAWSGRDQIILINPPPRNAQVRSTRAVGDLEQIPEAEEGGLLRARVLQ